MHLIFRAGDRVTWTEGKTRKARTGLVVGVHAQPGWEDAPEYDVQLLKKDGSLGRIQRRWHSELLPERKP